jgi:hypothetical protein
LIGTSLAALLLIGGTMPAGAWDRGDTEIFTVVPYLPGNVPVSIEGLTVGPDGTVSRRPLGSTARAKSSSRPICSPSDPTAHCSTTKLWSTRHHRHNPARICWVWYTNHPRKAC